MLNALQLPLSFDSSLKWITTAVVILHAGLVVSLWLKPLHRDVSKIPKEKIVVKTLVLRESKPSVAVVQPKVKEPDTYIPPVVKADLESVVANVLVEEIVPEPIVDKIPEPKPSVKPEVKKEAPKKESAKKLSPAKPPVAKKEPVKKEAPKKAIQKKDMPKSEKKVEVSPKPKQDSVLEEKKAKQKQLLAKAQENIAKINSNRDKLAEAKKQTIQAVTAPVTLGALHIDSIQAEGASSLNVREMGYRDELASRLKLLLTLPEHGEVKLRLTLERTGSVEKIAILSAQNASNRKYIEKTLPSLTFPGFGDNFVGHKNYTFLISLGNE